MIDRKHDLSFARQAELLQLSRGSIYYVGAPTCEADVALMREMDHIHTEYPHMGGSPAARLAEAPRVSR